MTKPHIVPTQYRGMRKWRCYSSIERSRRGLGPEGSGYTPRDAWRRWINAVKGRKIHPL